MIVYFQKHSVIWTLQLKTPYNVTLSFIIEQSFHQNVHSAQRVTQSLCSLLMSTLRNTVSCAWCICKLDQKPLYSFLNWLTPFSKWMLCWGNCRRRIAVVWLWMQNDAEHWELVNRVLISLGSFCHSSWPFTIGLSESTPLSMFVY